MSELLKFLGYKCKRKEVEDIIWEVDEDADGCLDLEVPVPAQKYLHRERTVNM